jgi:hypothetical protein
MKPIMLDGGIPDNGQASWISVNRYADAMIDLLLP